MGLKAEMTAEKKGAMKDLIVEVRVASSIVWSDLEVVPRDP